MQLELFVHVHKWQQSQSLCLSTAFIPALLHTGGGTPVLKLLEGHQKECHEFEQEGAISVALIGRCLLKQGIYKVQQ